MKTIHIILVLSIIVMQLHAQAPRVNDEISKSALSVKEKYRDVYQDLHRNPELSFMEFKTSEKMATALKAMGFEVTSHVGGNGVVGVLRNGPGKVIMLRTDMDALPVKENTGLPFSSTITGKNASGAEQPVMHACGHDLHMSVWQGTLETLVRLKKEWQGTILAVAEPAEEVSGGSAELIKDGLFEIFPKPDAILCYHVNPELPAGTIGYCTGPIFGGVGSCSITVYGIGGHGAMPHRSVDPIVLASRIVLDLQTIVSRETNPIKPAVVTVGAINGGTKNNIIPEEVKLLLSLRYFEDAVYEHIKEAITRIVKGDAMAAGLPDEKLPMVVFSNESTPPVINNEALVMKAAGSMKKLLGDDKVVKVDPAMVAEDFGRYGRTADKIPISLFWLGGANSARYRDFVEKGSPLPYLHSSLFAPDFDPAFVCGVEAMSSAIIGLLTENTRQGSVSVSESSIEPDSNSSDTIMIAGLGLRPGSRENAVPVLKQALEECMGKKNPVLVFQKGRYDFWPQNAEEREYFESNTDVIPLRRCAILIRGMKNLTIDCGGSDFIYHDRIQPFTIDSSENITIKNVNIDWDIPLTAQAEITEVTDSYIDLSINVLESPYIIENGKMIFTGEGWKSRWNGVMEFDRNTGIVAPQTGDPGCLGGNWERYRAEEITYGKVRLFSDFHRKPAKGNYLVLRHSARDHAGTFITGSKDISIINMNMYHNAGLGILSQFSENLKFRKVSAVPNPAKNRILSGHDDGFHYSNCKGQIIVDSCSFLHLMDDPINVHGTCVRIIEKKDGKTLVCRFMHGQSIGFVWARTGEKIGFIENDAMNTMATGIAETFKATSPFEFEISFRDAIPSTVSAGDALENLTWTPDVLIRNSYFGSNRARGILMTTPGKVIIENNIFESSGSAILIAGDANQWYESGAVKDVLIKGNIFRDQCMTSMYQFCEGIISIYPEIPKPELNKPYHRNIRIENNEFHPYDYPVLYAKSVDGLTFSGNRLVHSTRFEPFHTRKATFTFERCLNVGISGNSYEGEILGRNVILIDTPRKQVATGPGEKLKIEQKF